jgi:long-chain acyl-CoA synthetase
MNVAVLGERNISRFGEYEALLFEGRSYTNVELYEMSARLATSLGGLGIEPGDRVGVMLPNMPEVPITYGAVTRMGAVNIPMIFLLAVPEIVHILHDSEAKAIVTSPEFFPNVALACTQLDAPPTVIVAGDPVPDGALSFHGLVEEAGTGHPLVDRDGDDLALVSYTSGTTGRPKGVMLTHANMLFQGENTAGIADVRDGDRPIACLPLAHLFGFGASVVSNLFRQTIVLMRWFTAEGFFEALTTHKATHSNLVPTMLVYLLSHPDFDRADWSQFRWLVVGAAPVPVELADEFEKRTGAKVLEGYGLTETSPTATLCRYAEPRRPGSCGRPVPNVQIKIVDDQGNELPAGEPGEVLIKGPNVMKGYYKMPDETAKAVVGGWFHSGDVGHLDEDGYLYITERKKDLIIRGGFNIFPRDVEEVLYGHPSVAEAAVVGVPDPKLGEDVLAYVVLRPGAASTTEELMSLCRERLAKYKTPKHLRFVDALPKNAIGKILKKDLRERAKSDLGIAEPSG